MKINKNLFCYLKYLIIILCQISFPIVSVAKERITEADRDKNFISKDTIDNTSKNKTESTNTNLNELKTPNTNFELNSKCSDNKNLSQISRIDRDILLKDIELERFNIRYRSLTNVQGRWRGPRYILAQESNNAGTLAGLLSSIAIRSVPINKPYFLALNAKGQIAIRHRVPFRVGLEESLIPQLIGQSISAQASLNELIINLYHDHQAKKLGFDSARARKHVLSIKNDLANLFMERNNLLNTETAEITETDKTLLIAQGKVLRDICDLSLNEYVNFEIKARRFKTFQNSLYLIDIARNLTGVTGNIINLVGQQQRRPRLGATAGLMTFSSGALTFANPLFSRLNGIIAEKIYLQRLAEIRNINENTTLTNLIEDRQLFMNYLASNKEYCAKKSYLTELIQMQSLNSIQEEENRKKQFIALRELRAGTRSATQNIIAGAIVGSSKMSLGICNMIAGWKYPKDLVKANKIITGGSIAYASGAAIGLADNNRILIQNELNRKKFAKQRLLPNQVMEDHLKVLNELEKKLLVSN